MKHVIVTTLGCKVNQCESAAIGSQLNAAGYETAPKNSTADIIVINTCTVTGKAAMQSRQAIRQAVRQHPNAQIVVTGCYAQTAPEEIQPIKGINLIVGHSDKMRIADLLHEELSTSTAAKLIHYPIDQPHNFADMPSVAPDGRTRAFLKIQDGCNAFCTYCIVPHARGRSRSMPIADVQKHLRKLGAKGYREVVLTGIHLGAYGKDLDPPISFSDFLYQIIENCPVDRLRLSSIEPTEIDSDILEQISASDTPLCPHLHIPLQSGDDDILRRMGRPYSREKFRQVLRNAKRKLPQAAIGVDVLVGFPGESDSAFEQTYDLIKELPVSYLHVFPFSARKSTPAAGFENKVPEKEIKARCSRLRVLGERKKMDYFQSQVGQTAEVLIETLNDPATGKPKGHSANYLPIVIVDTGITAANTLITVHIEHMDKAGFLVGRKSSD